MGNVRSPTSSNNSTSPPKRSASSAGMSDKPHRPVKRRASKACQCCRARKVRCNVVEHGAPCTNCRLDEVECIVTESKRKRKSLPRLDEDPAQRLAQIRSGCLNNPPSILDGIANFPSLPKRRESNASAVGEHIPHSLYRTHSDRLHVVQEEQPPSRPPMQTANSAPTVADPSPGFMPSNGTFQPTFPARLSLERALPYYLKPVPPRMGADEVAYLEKRGALTVPSVQLRDELCRAYVEFVHPYMPLIDLQEFLHILQRGDGSLGRISLLLFQAIMFAGSAFVDMSSLRKAGFATRKEARKEFFQRVRKLYDFDYDMDRFSQVQALLLMTSWYETSDDKKDAWHWMGIAIATSYTIGLHRDPAHSNMELQQQRQWKRVWWSCVIRDRLIALGMRRPIRIKPEDCDVPMLALDDFELCSLSEDVTCVPPECTVARDVEKQKLLASMCIQKAKLSLCMAEVLAAQYSIHISAPGGGEHDMRGSFDSESSSVATCHQKLEDWVARLPPELALEAPRSRELVPRSEAPLVVHRAVLHMIYFATLGALHRPQVLHGTPAPHGTSGNGNMELSRQNVQYAATETTRIAKSLLNLNFVRFLPTTGVTVLQPAIISHLLDIKSQDDDIRKTALQGFCQCIQVMGKLRDCYTAADHSVALVEAAIRRADIKVPTDLPTPSSESSITSESHTEKRAETAEDLVDAGVRQNLVTPSPGGSQPITPHPVPTNSTSNQSHTDNDNEDKSTGTSTPSNRNNTVSDAHNNANPTLRSDVDIARKLEVFLASTPLEAEPQNVPGVDYLTCQPVGHYTYDGDFESFVDFSGDGGPSSAGGMHMLHADQTHAPLDSGGAFAHPHGNALGQFVGSPGEQGMHLFFSDMVDVRTPGAPGHTEFEGPGLPSAGAKMDGTSEFVPQGIMSVPVPS